MLYRHCKRTVFFWKFPYLFYLSFLCFGGVLEKTITVFKLSLLDSEVLGSTLNFYGNKCRMYGFILNELFSALMFVKKWIKLLAL